MKKLTAYLLKFTKEDTAFLGWRVSLRREKRQFSRYFSALEWGGMDQAEAAARQIRDALLADLASSKESVQEIFARYSKPKPDLPKGIRLLNPGQKRSRPKACSLKLGQKAGEQMEALSAQWDITANSIVRIALYMFFCWFAAEEQKGMDLKDLVKCLTEQTKGKLPSFDEFWEVAEGEDE